MRFDIFLAIGCLSVGLLSGCDANDDAPLPERFARRILPYEKTWRSESEIPSAPQKTPAMVVWELSEFPPDAVATPEQSAAAQALVDACFASATRHGWFDAEQGKASGYVKPKHDPVHYRNNEYMLDGRMVDPDRPENLMYYRLSNGEVELAGFMFLADTRAARGPQVGGPLTVWHYHIWRKMQCVANDVVPLGWAKDGVCEEGAGSHRSAEMLHVWLVDHPAGPFATSMMIGTDEMEVLIAKRMKERGY